MTVNSDIGCMGIYAYSGSNSTVIDERPDFPAAFRTRRSIRWPGYRMPIDWALEFLDGRRTSVPPSTWRRSTVPCWNIREKPARDLYIFC